jgi:hypothetical protein
MPNHCYWTDAEGIEFEIHYRTDGDNIIDFSLYPPREVSLKDERDILDLIADDISYGD